MITCASCQAIPTREPWLHLRRVNVQGRPGVFLCPRCDPARPEAPAFEFNPPPAETPDRLVHDAMKQSMHGIAAVLSEAVPPGTGFALFVFQYGPGGWLTYVSSADRPDVRRLLAEWLATA